MGRKFNYIFLGLCFFYSASLLAASGGPAATPIHLHLAAKSDPIFEILQPYLAYDASIDIDRHRPQLVENFVIKALNIDLTKLSGRISLEKLLSPFAQRWAHKVSEKDGPNCFHNAMASTNQNWKVARFMDDMEFDYHLRKNAKKIADWDKTSPLEFGDIISFYCAEQGLVHAAVYVGHADGEAIVFQKMAYSWQQPYAFMKLSDSIKYAIADHYHVGDDISVEASRLFQPAVDPLTEKNPSVPVLDFEDIPMK